MPLCFEEWRGLGPPCSLVLPALCWSLLTYVSPIVLNVLNVIDFMKMVLVG